MSGSKYSFEMEHTLHQYTRPYFLNVCASVRVLKATANHFASMLLILLIEACEYKTIFTLLNLKIANILSSTRPEIKFSSIEWPNG